ncbi:MAG TPA: BamA/TamA family outer membrane protein [Cyclobacteriaceae bacterium]|nr:BamA/TamA family outer membrane protein [Cyclobacteriaceae bacterium]
MSGSTKILVYVLVLLLLGSCRGTRYLQENQKLLDKQSIEAPKGINKTNLSDLYIQKINRKFLGLPINSLVWMHHEGEKHYDQQKFIDKKAKVEAKFDRKIAGTQNTKKIANYQYRKQNQVDELNKKIEEGNLFMQWGEQAAVFDTANVTATEDKMNDYLFNEGYFKNNVTSTTKEYKKRVSVTYHINPGKAYFFDTLFYQIADSGILKIIQQTHNQSLIRRSERYKQDILNKERERIDLLLKDRGYFNFTRQYVEFSIDTAFRGTQQVAVRVEITNPPRRNSHQVFRVDSILFTTDAAVNTRDTLKRTYEEYNSITFNYFRNQYNKKVLSRRVSIHKDSLYSRSATFNSQRQLANLDIFKFINVNYEQISTESDSSAGQFISHIFCSPLDRYSWSNEAGVTVTQGFPGPYISTNFKMRNLFRGLEILEINGRYGFEGVASVTDRANIYTSTEASLNGSITFPQFLFPFGEKAATRMAKYNPRTRLLAGFTFTERPEYTRSITTVSNTYTWQNKQTTQLSLTLINLNIIRSRLDSTFNALLTDLQNNQGNNLKNSFNPSFVSSMIFGITWNPNNYGNTEKSSFFMRAQAETGGTLFNFAEPGYILRQGLELYQYVRFNLDLRRSVVINKTTVLAYRFNTGVGYAYSDNKVLPYEKYFFAGGSNSVRAWLPRRLGIGTVPPNLSENADKDGLFDYSFEKPGEVLLEGSIELRKKLFGFVNGAIFIDAGNVWSFRQIQIIREGSNVASWNGSTRIDGNFYKQLGVGTGFGFRFDFSFLVLRLDMGIKVLDPGRPEGQRFVLNKMKFFGPFVGKEPVIFNIGIGYPF